MWWLFKHFCCGSTPRVVHYNKANASKSCPVRNSLDITQTHATLNDPKTEPLDIPQTHSTHSKSRSKSTSSSLDEWDVNQPNSIEHYYTLLCDYYIFKCGCLDRTDERIENEIKVFFTNLVQKVAPNLEQNVAPRMDHNISQRKTFSQYSQNLTDYLSSINVSLEAAIDLYPPSPDELEQKILSLREQLNYGRFPVRLLLNTM